MTKMRKITTMMTILQQKRDYNNKNENITTKMRI